MYIRMDDPEERGTIVGFDKRFIAVPIRNKGIGAIVSQGTEAPGALSKIISSVVETKRETESAQAPDNNDSGSELKE